MTMTRHLADIVTCRRHLDLAVYIDADVIADVDMMHKTPEWERDV